MLFCIFMASLWCYTSKIELANGLIGGPEFQMLTFQSASLIMMLVAYSSCAHKDRAWRTVLVTMSFICLSQSTLVALLSSP